MRYIIIGGSGFVGLELIRQLQQRSIENIVVLDIKKPIADVLYEYQDITNELTFNFKKDDIVIQLAANQYHNKVPRKNRSQFFDSVNVTGNKNILEKMSLDGARNMVFFSTDMVYGKPQFIPVTTEHPKKPFGYYGKSKLKAEDLCKKFRKLGFNITIFRPRMIVGPGRLGILIKLFKLINYNLPIPLIGSGHNCYQMVSVKDCASAILCAIDKKLPNQEFNLGSDNPPTVKMLMNNLIKKSGSKSLIIPTPGKLVKLALSVLGSLGIEVLFKEQFMIADENYIIDISQTTNQLGWKPKYNDSDMLFAAYEDYKKGKQNL